LAFVSPLSVLFENYQACSGALFTDESAILGNNKWPVFRAAKGTNNMHPKSIIKNCENGIKLA
jgi:hypothetical protein